MSIEKKRITGRFCPECQSPMIFYGSIKYGMVICLNEECRNHIPLEESLKMEDTIEGKKIYKTGYGVGYEDGFEVAKNQGSEIEEGFLDEIDGVG